MNINRKKAVTMGLITSMLLAFVFIGLNVNLAPAIVETTVYIDPSSVTVSVCDNFTVDVNIEDVVDLWAWEFNITFDPNLLECISVTEGPFLKSSGSTFFIPIIDNDAGWVVAACSRIGAPPGSSGSGTLAYIEFHCEGPGSCPLHFEPPPETILWDKTPDQIPYVAIDGSVTQTGHPEDLELYPREVVDLEDPTCTQWHELHPNKTNYYHLTSWEPGKVLSPCDQIDMIAVDPPVKIYLENVTSFDPTNPICSKWHEIEPMWCQYWHLSSWEDTNGDRMVSPSDQIDMTDEYGNVTWFHVQEIMEVTPGLWHMILDVKYWFEVDDVTVDIRVFNVEMGITYYLDYKCGKWTFDPENPISTKWNEINALPEPELVFGRTWHLTSWEDNGDGKLGPCDYIDMTIMHPYPGAGDVMWFHVEAINVTLKLTPKPSPPVVPPPPDGPVYLESELGYYDFHPYQEKPICTYWHEIYPLKSRWWHLSSWEDSLILSPSDQIVLTLKDEFHKPIPGTEAEYHVDKLTVAMNLTSKLEEREHIVKFEGSLKQFKKYHWDNPNCTQWHEVNPNYSRQWHLIFWNDTNGSGRLDYCDQIVMIDKETGWPEEFHVESLSTDIIVSPKPPHPGPIIAAGSSDQNVYVLDDSGNLLWSFNTGAAVASVAMSVNGSYIAVGSLYNALYLFDNAGTLLWSRSIPIERSYDGGWRGTESKSVAISADGAYIVAACTNGLYLYDNAGTLIWHYYDGSRETCVGISADGNYIVACRYFGEVHFFSSLYDGAAGWSSADETPAWNRSIGAFWVAIDGLGQYVSASTGNRVYLFNRAGTQIWNCILPGISGTDYVRVDMPWDGRSIVAANDDPGDGACYLWYFNDTRDGMSGWSGADGTPVWSYTPCPPEEDFLSVDISKYGKIIATGPGRNPHGLHVFSRSGPPPLQTIADGTVQSVDLTFTGQYGAAGDWQGRVWFFSKDSNTPLWNYNVGAKIHCVAISEIYPCMFPFPNHDVAVLDVSSLYPSVYQGQIDPISVTVGNQGDYTETFDVNAYYDGNLAAPTQTVTLGPGASTTLTFNWDTSGVPVGTYTISACATPVQDEIEIGDNTLIDGTQEVTLPLPPQDLELYPKEVVDLGDPTCTQWHELHPSKTNYYHLTSWEPGKVLSPCDQIDMIAIHPPVKIYLENVTSFDPTNPICSVWHEVEPTYSQKWHLSSWEDTNGDGVVSPSDQIDMTIYLEPEEYVVWFHVQEIMEVAPGLWLLILDVKYWFEVDDVTVDIRVFDAKMNITYYLDYKCGKWTFDPENPISTKWNEINALPEPELVFGRTWHLTSWEDNGDGRLSPCDYIDMTIMYPYPGAGDVMWFHVEAINVTLKLTPKPSPPVVPPPPVGPVYLESELGYYDFHPYQEDPVCTYWHEIYPLKSRWWHLSSWEDSLILSPSDQVVLTLKDPVTHEPIPGTEAEYHVDKLTVAMNMTSLVIEPLPYERWRIVKFEGSLKQFKKYHWVDPISTQWHEVNPNYSRQWHLIYWNDTNGSGRLDYCDQIVMIDKETGWLEKFHVESLSTDIWITKKPLPPPPPPPVAEDLELWPPEVVDLGDPTCTQWHELHPNKTNYYHLTSWEPGEVLSPCDQIDMYAVEPPVKIYLENITSFDPTNPICSEWHETAPNFSQLWHLSSWEDTNDDGILSPSDQIDMTNLEIGAVVWFHVQNITEAAPGLWLLILDVKYWFEVDEVTVDMVLLPHPTNDKIFVEYKCGYWTFDPENPISTKWNQIDPVLGPVRCLHLTSWNDTNGDGKLSPSDTIDMTPMWPTPGPVEDYDVVSMYISLKLTPKPSPPVVPPPPVGPIYLESEISYDEFDLANPVCTYWHEIYPVYSRIWHLSSWEDSLILSPSDQIVLTLKDEFHKPIPGTEAEYHVDKLTVAMNMTSLVIEPLPYERWRIVKFEGSLKQFKKYHWIDPVSTQWHEVNPNYSRQWHLIYWNDTNADGMLSPCDVIIMMDKETGLEEPFHVNTLSTDIIVTQKVHDVAVIEVKPSRTIIGKEQACLVGKMSIDVKVENQGHFTETFNVTAYYDSNQIGSPQAVTLNPGENKTLTFLWNITGVAKGNYTIKANATPVPGETDTADNTQTDGTVLVTIPGDVSGDCTCDMLDISILIDKFLSEPGDPQWDPNCDVNCDGMIDMLDISIAIDHFLQTCQDDP